MQYTRFSMVVLSISVFNRLTFKVIWSFKGRNIRNMSLIHNAFQGALWPEIARIHIRRPIHGKCTTNYSSDCEMLMQDILHLTSDVQWCTILHENGRIEYFFFFLLQLRHHKVLKMLAYLFEVTKHFIRDKVTYPFLSTFS